MYVLTAINITATITAGSGSYDSNISLVIRSPKVKYPKAAVPVYVATHKNIATETVLENCFRFLGSIHEYIGMMLT